MKKLYNLFNALVLYDYNIRILHWKVNSLDFDSKHTLMDGYHSTLNGFIDEVGEILLMTGNTNMPSLVDVLKGIENDDDNQYVSVDGSEYFSPKNVISLCKGMFTQLIEMYDDVHDIDLPSDVVSKLEEHQYWLRKESMYKLTSTLS